MTKLVTTSRVDAVVNILTAQIHDGLYPPGSKLPSERKLQDEFGVGRLALREALSRMNAMGLIETMHGRGTFVQGDVKSRTLKNVLIPYFALTDSKRLRDFVEARAMIESEIAWLAARQRTEKDISRLEEILTQPFDPVPPYEEVAARDLSFHKELASMIDNHFLAIMHDALTAHIKGFLHRFVEGKQDHREVMEAHQPILEAIRRGDAEDARKLMRLHLSFSMQDYEDYVRREQNS